MGPSGSVIIENLHKYKLHRKQVGLLTEGDHQGRPLAHTTKRLARVMAQLPESCGAEAPIQQVHWFEGVAFLRWLLGNLPMSSISSIFHIILHYFAWVVLGSRV